MSPPAVAQSGALRLLVSNGMKGSLEALEFRRRRPLVAAVHRVQLHGRPEKRKIAAGEAFDATIITVEAIDEAIAPTPRRRITDGGRPLPTRIGIRSGAPERDIRTPEALKQSLLAAKSITFPQDGASRGYLEEMFERLGVAAQLKPKIILAPGSGPATESVARGDAAMVLTLFSEIVTISGVEVLGPLPGAYRFDIRFAAAASAKSPNEAAAKALIAFLTSPAAAPVLKAKGIEPK